MQNLPADSATYGVACSFPFFLAGPALLTWAYLLAPVLRRLNASTVCVAGAVPPPA